MRKEYAFPLLLTIGVLLFALAILPLTASAIAREDGTTAEQPTSSDQPTTLSTSGDQGKRLSGKALQACDKQAANIKSTMRRGVMRVVAQKKKFDTVSKRVQAFYEKQGLSTGQYETLVEAVTSTEATVQADIDSLKASGTFSCEGTDPKAMAQTFKGNLQAAAENLKAYRTALKALIEDVRSAEGR